MQLVYTDTGKPVKKLDVIETHDNWVEVQSFKAPELSADLGYVYVVELDWNKPVIYCVSQIRAHWIGRDNQTNTQYFKQTRPVRISHVVYAKLLNYAAPTGKLNISDAIAKVLRLLEKKND